MGYRRWFRVTTCCILGAMVLIAGIAWLVDPIEIWEAPVIRGFNHIKPKQRAFIEIFKPFQVQRHKPDIIYIGTSRVFVGFRPEKNAYNMGGSSLSLPDMREYLRFVYSQHVPKKVFIGLDLFQFSHESMTAERNGFSKERLLTLRKGTIASIAEAIEISYGMTRYLKETVRSSFKNKSKPKEWDKGYSVKRGEQKDIDGKGYYHNLNSYFKTYTNYTYDPESILCLQDILKEAADHDVDAIMFFNPVSIDLLALQHICGRTEEYQSIKNAVAAFHPVYDFAWASSLSLDRKVAWLDGSHYHRPVGDRMKASMTRKIDSEICRVLTAETVDAHLREETAQYEQWAAEHSDYIQALAEAAPEKIPVGELKQYLGF